jgi:predicted porin
MHNNLELALNYVMGEQERISTDKNTEWAGYAFYARYKFNTRFSLAARYEILSDETDKNIASSSDATFLGGTVGNEINGITLTAAYDLMNNSELRFEYNQLDSDKKDFSDVSSGTAKSDDGRTAYTLAWIARF